MKQPLTAPAKRGRRRSVVSRKAVLDAAYALLLEKGLKAFSIEAIASVSGVARTTIYRSWPTRGHLLMESFLSAYEPLLQLQSTVVAEQDLRALIRSLAKALNGPAGALAASVIAEAQTSEETRQLFRELFSEPLRRRSEDLLQAGVQAGTFRSDLDISTTIDAIVGPAYLRLLFGLPLTPKWADSLANTILEGCLSRLR